MPVSRHWAVVCGVALCYSLVGCEGGKGEFKSAKDVTKERAGIIQEKDAKRAAEHEHEHHHHAPHHGSLTMLGDHVAQIELTVDADAGKLSVYVLDGEAEKPLALDQAELELSATPDGATEPLPLKLVPADAAKQDDGFVAQNDKLKGVTKLTGTLASLKIKGKDASEKVAVEFDAKKAAAEAEEAHHHGHDDHKDHDHKAETKGDAHKDHDKDHDHDEKDHKDEPKK